MLRATWTGGSLRFWVGIGMLLAVLPFVVSAVGGFVLLDRGVIGAFQDVAQRQRAQIDPLLRLRVALWESAVPVNQFLDDDDPRDAAEYRRVREQIEAGFAELQKALASEPEARALVERARADWTTASHLANEVITVRRRPGDPRPLELAQRFDGATAAAVDTLAAVYDDLSADLRQDHDQALLAYERAHWLAGIAAGVSLAMMVAGVLIIGRFMLASVDRLVDGAERFASGDRDHRIDVRVPPELGKVADEFNRMIARIRESERALDDLAHRDRTTGLPNRRAFDEALEDAWRRMERTSETVALLMLDLDHFKRVNDTHGHDVGDRALEAVANSLQSAGANVPAFRIGGEEFAVLLHGAAADAAPDTAEQLRSAIAGRPVWLDGGPLCLSVSIGVAIAHSTAEARVLTRSADQALYRAKAAGRNRVVVG
jgi:diguanylate cyclase (GGDEF)-like protein